MATVPSLPAATPVLADVVYVPQSPFGGGDDKKVTLTDLRTLMQSGGLMSTKGVTTAVSISTNAESLIAVTDTSAVRTITLSSVDIAAGSPTAPVFFTIKDESLAAGTNNITIDTEGGELIDGVASILINANGGVARLYSNGTNLFTI